MTHMKTAVVTGGAGLIGSFLSERLLAAGWKVRILDNESTGKRTNVPAGAEYVRGDVRDVQALAQVFTGKVDLVLHLAAQVSNILSYQAPSEDVTTNVLGTLNVLEQCRLGCVPRLLHASSMALYGQPDVECIDERVPVNPLSYYGISKLAAENYVMAASRRKDLRHEFNVTALRMFNVYGPRQSLTNPYQGVISVFIANLLDGTPITLYGSGLQSRDFIYIDDIVNAWMLALESPASYGQVINVGSGTSLSINEMLDAVLRAFGHTRQTYPIRGEPELSGDQFRVLADVSRARTLLNWQPQTSFEAGLRATIAWARAEHAGTRRPVMG